MATMATMAASVSNLQVSPEFNVFQFNPKGMSWHFKLDIANARGNRCWVRGSILYPNKAPAVAKTRAFANSQGASPTLGNSFNNMTRRTPGCEYLL